MPDGVRVAAMLVKRSQQSFYYWFNFPRYSLASIKIAIDFWDLKFETIKIFKRWLKYIIYVHDRWFTKNTTLIRRASTQIIQVISFWTDAKPLWKNVRDR